jgi:hypothetical protein
VTRVEACFAPRPTEPLRERCVKSVLGARGEATTATEGPIAVYLVVVDERLYGEFHKVGLDLLNLHPAPRPSFTSTEPGQPDCCG